MSYSNTENIDWNNLHNGKRVPINDTDTDGAPFALKGNDIDWASGSVNIAVCETYELTTPLTEIDALNRVLDLSSVRFLANKNMLYGYKGDARNKLPLDQMSFRGYPTVEVINELFEVAHMYNQTNWNLNGSIGSEVGQFTIMSATIQIKHVVPYDIVYTTILTDELGTQYFNVDVKIAAGNTNITHYYDEATDSWPVLPLGEIFFSVNSTSFVGTKTFTNINENLIQAPFYGTLNSVEVDAPESEYNPIVLPTYQSIGVAYYVPFLTNISCYINTCSEVSETIINTGTVGEIYMSSEDTLSVGCNLYYDRELTQKIVPGHYIWASIAYNNSSETLGVVAEENIFRLSQYLYFDDTLGITEIYKNVNAGIEGCYIKGGACG